MANDANTITDLVKVQDELLVRSPDWYRALQQAIDHLIQHDFEQLVQVLYQVDVSEEKLKNLLRQNPASNAATLIANLMLQRQLEKIKWRRKNAGKQAPDLPDAEKW